MFIHVSPTNNLVKVLRRQITLPDNLGTGLSVGQYQKRLIEDKRYNPTQRHEERHKKRLTDLLPRPESLREINTRISTDNTKNHQGTWISNVLTVLKEIYPNLLQSVCVYMRCYQADLKGVSRVAPTQMEQ